MSEKPERKKCIYGWGICLVREEMTKEAAPKQPMIKVVGPSKPTQMFSDAQTVTKEAEAYAKAMRPFLEDMMGKILIKTDWCHLQYYCNICPKHIKHCPIRAFSTVPEKTAEKKKKT